MVELLGPERREDAEHRQEQRRRDGVEQHQPQFATPTCTTKIMVAPTAAPTIRPRVTPPRAKPQTSSPGAQRRHQEVADAAWILAIISDEVVLAKAFWTMAIMIRPGARNGRTARRRRRRAGGEGEQENRQEQQRRHHRRDHGLHRHFEEATHLAQIERPQAEPIDRAELAHAQMGFLARRGGQAGQICPRGAELRSCGRGLYGRSQGDKRVLGWVP